MVNKDKPMKRLDLIERKLKAIKDKSAEEIAEKRIYLPIVNLGGLMQAQKATSIQSWLGKRVAILEDAKLLSEKDIQRKIATLYQKLPVKLKKIVDGQLTVDFHDAGYETFIALHLYAFSLGEFE